MRTLAWLVPVPGFNYDHCQSQPLLSARVSFSEKPWLSFSHNNPPSHYTGTHCLPRDDDGEILLAIKVCLLSPSVHLVCACLQVADVSSVTLVTSLQSPEPAFTCLEHSHSESVSSGRRYSTYGYHTRQMLCRRGSEKINKFAAR